MLVAGGFKHCNDSKSCNGYLNDMDDIHENIAEYTPNKERKRLIVFDNIIGNMLFNKNLQQTVTIIRFLLENETFFLHLLHNLILLYQKILNYTLIKKNSNTLELQQVSVNHSSDIEFKDFINL